MHGLRTSPVRRTLVMVNKHLSALEHKKVRETMMTGLSYGIRWRKGIML